MSTQAASTRPMNRPMQDAPNRATVNEPTRPIPMIHDGHREQMPSPGTETKQSFLTTEFWIYIAAVTAVTIAAFWRGTTEFGLNLNNPGQAWFFITLLTLGYLGSRGLAKAGSARRSGEERSRRGKS
ncbi:hypothetical protein GA0070616_4322 [Micromonospora nigra]|uniref:Uncharacterized protein n=2 Tax=Micromonospora nigra TaxID=145857 RepID=A0A1C6SQG5_9ACTN|nr:hypothetical protein [Micromonospora nigra]SCL31737.1 hypothetical protein GA0070616_4322 [Micromonospora nigra]